jgi:hypothetical protein
MLLRRKEFFASYDAYVAGFRAAFPKVDIVGSADVYPLSQALALGPGVICRPRPIFQSYCAYTPRLAELNAAHLRTDRAADHVLFNIQTIDGRLAPQDDSLSWPELLTRYDVTGAAEPFIVMRKSATPRQYQFIPISETVAKLGETINIPAVSDGPIWVKIDIRRSLYGNILAMLYRPSGISFILSTRSGKQYGGRLLPGLARTGFVLSPFIENCQSFAALASSTWQNELAQFEVATVRIIPDEKPGVRSCYQPVVRVRFYRLDFPRHDSTLLER